MGNSRVKDALYRDPLRHFSNRKLFLCSFGAASPRVYVKYPINTIYSLNKPLKISSNVLGESSRWTLTTISGRKQFQQSQNIFLPK